jgi:hypothetical protein
MFDFRYHALSLAAVLLSLCIGLLLGVAIGDRGLASSAREDLRDDLRSEVVQARAESRELTEQLERRNRFEEETLPLLVGGRLEDRRVAVVLLGEPDSQTFEHVRDVVTQAGGDVTSVSRLRLPLDLERLSADSVGTRFARLAEDPELLEPFGARIGEQLVHGGRFLSRVQGSLFASSSGALGGAEAVVVARAAAPDADREDLERTDAFAEAMIEGVRAFETPLVGVELTSTDPSQIDWYEERGIASVDSVDLPSGRAALVFVLVGAADGAYGIKPSSDALLPEAVTRRP